MKVWRQGDIYIAAIPTIPRAATPRPGRLLFKGELTGHAHRFEEGPELELFMLPSDDRERPGPLFYARLQRTTKLVHEEHEPIELEAGSYRLWRQREYFPRSIRAVMD